jgi:hypothetical protein
LLIVFIKKDYCIPPSGILDLSRFWLFCLGPLVFLSPNILKSFGF